MSYIYDQSPMRVSKFPFSKELKSKIEYNENIIDIDINEKICMKDIQPKRIIHGFQIEKLNHIIE